MACFPKMVTKFLRDKPAEILKKEFKDYVLFDCLKTFSTLTFSTEEHDLKSLH